MNWRHLRVADKPAIEEFLRHAPRELSAYTFAGIYVWQGLYKISWAVEHKHLCIMFRDTAGCFMYLPPLGAGADAALIERLFDEMDETNRNTALSRFDNVDETCRQQLAACGLCVQPKPGEYLCARASLASLRGNAYKHKRASANHFAAHYRYCYRSYQPQDAAACRHLYELWAGERCQAHQEAGYRGMLVDSRSAFDEMLNAPEALGMWGRVVEVDGAIGACTFGMPVNDETVCVMFEVADLRLKGIAAFIFKAVCEEMSAYRYVNIMDDSGLENLRSVKESYRPQRMVAAYTAVRPAGSA